MGTGILAWACLLLGPSAPADDVVHFNQRGFQIPITVQPSRRAEVKELILFVSRNEGRNWDAVGRAKPDKPGIDFLAQQDGMHWFSIAVIDQRGYQDPPDIARAPVGQKILIDTTKPQTRLVSAERVGQEVVVNWEAFDERPDWATFRLEYRAHNQPGNLWTPLAVHAPSSRGSHRFLPGVPGPLTVRLMVKDLAGNEGHDEKLVPEMLNTSPGLVDPALSRAAASGPLPSMDNSPLAPPPPPGPLPPPSSGGIAAEPIGFPAPATTTTTPPAPMPGFTPEGPAPTRGPLPTLKVVNKREVKLRFGVEKYGHSGLGSVEVYMTADEGATWELIKPTSVQLPQVVGAGGPPATGSLTVQLPRDAVTYGFYIVVKSRLGMGDAPPVPGTQPQVRLEMDLTPPEAILRLPKPDSSDTTRMVFTWTATDRHLDSNPITLEWSAKPEGPWEFIGDPKLPNTGSYAWTLSPRIPPQVYLKMTVRDKAGNTSVAKTPQPIDMDTSRPIVRSVEVSD